MRKDLAEKSLTVSSGEDEDLKENSIGGTPFKMKQTARKSTSCGRPRVMINKKSNPKITNKFSEDSVSAFPTPDEVTIKGKRKSNSKSANESSGALENDCDLIVIDEEEFNEEVNRAEAKQTARKTTGRYHKKGHVSPTQVSTSPTGIRNSKNALATDAPLKTTIKRKNDDSDNEHDEPVVVIETVLENAPPRNMARKSTTKSKS